MENPINKKWIVLWQRGGRVGSFGLTKMNLDELKRQFYLQLIQTDYTGSKHYNILGVKKAGKRAKLMKGNPVKIPEKVLAWRERKRKGSIMKPATFRGIKRKAKKAGYAIPSAVGGKAYWITTLRKYLDTHPGDKTAMRTLRKLLGTKKKVRKGLSEADVRYARRYGIRVTGPTYVKAKGPKGYRWRRKRNPSGKKWYVGQKIKGRAEVFSSSVNPTRRTHGHLYKYASGSFKTKGEAEGWARNLWAGR